MERGTFAIDESYFAKTCDKVKIGDRFYSDKTPLMGVYMAIPYWVLYNVFGLSFRENPEVSYYILSVLSTGLSTLLLTVFLYRLLRLGGARENTALALTAVAYFSTITMSYSLVITNHIPAAAFIVCAYYYVFSGKHVVGGIFAGLAVFADPEAVFLITPLLFNRGFIKVVAGGAPVAVVFILWNYLMAGSVLPFQMRPELFQFKGSFFANPEALSGTAIKHKSIDGYLSYLFHYTFGKRGLFIYSPICILGLAGLIMHYRKFPHVVAGFILFILGTTLTTNNYSGWSYGVRWHLLVIPLLVYASFPLFEKPSRVVKSIAAALAVAGLLSSAVGAIDPYTITMGNDSSFKAQFSGERRYVEHVYTDAMIFIEDGKYKYAKARLKESLRRNPDFRPARKTLARLNAALETGAIIKIKKPETAR